MAKNRNQQQQQPLAQQVAAQAEAEQAAQEQEQQTAEQEVVEQAEVEQAEEQAPVIVHDTPVAAEEPVVEVASPTANVPSNQAASFILVELDKYAAEMAPRRPINAIAGAAKQVLLFRMMDRVFNRVSAEDFPACMDTLTQWFHDNKDGVCADTHIFRFSGEWSAMAEEWQAFVSWATLLKNLSDVKSRQHAVQNIHFDKYFQYSMTDPGRERVLAYFGK